MPGALFSTGISAVTHFSLASAPAGERDSTAGRPKAVRPGKPPRMIAAQATRYLLSDITRAARRCSDFGTRRGFVPALLLLAVSLAGLVRISHVRAYLERAELREPSPCYRECYRLAWHLLNREPFERAFHRMYGRHPARVWPELYRPRIVPIPQYPAAQRKEILVMAAALPQPPTLQQLTLNLHQETPPAAEGLLLQLARQLAPFGFGLGEMERAWSRALIAAALEEERGNACRAAQRLGIHRNSLSRRIERDAWLQSTLDELRRVRAAQKRKLPARADRAAYVAALKEAV